MPILRRKNNIQEKTRNCYYSECRVKAVINIPLKKEEALRALKTLQEENRDNERIQTEYKATNKGLEIIIQSTDTTGLRAGINGALKLYKVHEEVKKCLK